MISFMFSLFGCFNVLDHFGGVPDPNASHPKKHTSFLFQKLYACTSAPGSICQSLGLLLATDHLNFHAKGPQPPFAQVFPLKMAACPRDNAFLG